MILGDVWGIALSILGFLLSLQGLWLVCRALWPARVDAAAARCERNGLACFFVGLGVTIVWITVAIVAGRAGAPGQMVGFAIGFLYLIFAGIGSAGFVTHIGRRLASPAVDAERPWRATVRGGVALELACLIPLLGWFGILPISFIIGAGSATLAMFNRTRPVTERSPSFARTPATTPAYPPIDLPALEPAEALR